MAKRRSNQRCALHSRRCLLQILMLAASGGSVLADDVPSPTATAPHPNSGTTWHKFSKQVAGYVDRRETRTRDMRPVSLFPRSGRMRLGRGTRQRRYWLVQLWCDNWLIQTAHQPRSEKAERDFSRHQEINMSHGAPSRWSRPSW